jgi:hypothetical protein
LTASWQKKNIILEKGKKKENKTGKNLSGIEQKNSHLNVYVAPRFDFIFED